jgi:hypothetical protein
MVVQIRTHEAKRRRSTDRWSGVLQVNIELSAHHRSAVFPAARRGMGSAWRTRRYGLRTLICESGVYEYTVSEVSTQLDTQF